MTVTLAIDRCVCICKRGGPSMCL